LLPLRICAIIIPLIKEKQEEKHMSAYESINAQANAAIDELLEAADTLKTGDILVIGCSTSEVMGKLI